MDRGVFPSYKKQKWLEQRSFSLVPFICVLFCDQLVFHECFQDMWSLKLEDL